MKGGERGEGLKLTQDYGAASSDIRFYKERAGILEGSRGWLEPTGGGVGIGININYAPKGCLWLETVILPCVTRLIITKGSARALSWL